MAPHSNAKLRVVIPARYGSSRLPGKPLVDLAGKPMIVRVYEAVSSALRNVDIVVAVDDERIMLVLNERGIPAVMTRSDHESGTDRAAEVAVQKRWNDEDIIINVQGDEPLIPVSLLQSFADFCGHSKDLSMATLAVPLDTVEQLHDPNVVKLTLTANDHALAFSRSAIPFCRDLPVADWPYQGFLRHIGIYAYRCSVLQRLTTTPPCALEKLEKLEQLRAQWLEIKIKVMKWQVAPPHGVDTPEDAARTAKIFEGRIK